MIEYRIDTVIGDEIEVAVYFEYHKAEPQTRDCPESPSCIEITAVFVDNDKEKDILYVLSDEICGALELEAIEHLESEID